MTEAILALVPTYGLPFLFSIAVLAAMGVPLPSTLIVMAVGAFVAGGDLGLTSAFLTALAAATIGDQIGYQIGLHAGNAVEERLSRKPSRAAQIANTKHLVERFGGVTVFLTRWLLAPIGPTTNIICGASDMRWLRFTIWDFLGEVVWVAIYLGIGYAFRGNIEELSAILGGASWLIIAALVTIFLGFRLLAAYRKERTPA
ncbi:MAG: DedA family protein [Alphaproteobacteria bacterium]